MNEQELELDVYCIKEIKKGLRDGIIHSTKFSILTITRDRYNKPVSGRRAMWTQFGLHPPLCKLRD
jgi:hypothetical protein